MTLTVRPGVVLDAGPMAALMASAVGGAWDEPALSRVLADDAMVVGVATDAAEHALVGAAVVRVVLDEAELLLIAVAPEARRRGVAKQLMADAMERSAQRGACRMFLEVAADNAPAISMYEASGFAPIGRRKAYYPRPSAPAMDALLLARDIDKPC
jgi:ribosomal-protein-alanine N-acetyltransferase